MNRNKTKKIKVWFSQLWYIEQVEKEAKKEVLKFLAPLSMTDRIELAKKSMSDEFASPSNIIVGSRKLPKIEGFNCTWIRDPSCSGFYAQFTFANGEEKKVMKIIEKYGGKLVNPDLRLNQYQIEEINSSGKTNQIELANEILKGDSFDNIVRRY